MYRAAVSLFVTVVPTARLGLKQDYFIGDLVSASNLVESTRFDADTRSPEAVKREDKTAM